MGSNPISGSAPALVWIIAVSDSNQPISMPVPLPRPLPLPIHYGEPKVAVSFTGAPGEASPAEAIAQGMDIAELRIDRFANHDVDHVLAQAKQFAAVPTIATIRSAAEGGDWSDDDEQRRALYEAVIPHVGAVDVEVSSTRVCEPVVAASKAHGSVAIMSFHDFNGTPPAAELDATIERARGLGADIVKVATMVNSADDLRTLAGVLCGDHDVGLIVIGMGEAGAPSRALFPFLGSRLTFASLGRPSAPGQLSLADTVRALGLASPAYAARHPTKF